MGDSLPGILPVVDHDSVALVQFFGFGDLGGGEQEFPEDGFVVQLGSGEPGESVFVLGDDEDVDRSNRSDVSEGEDVLIFVDDVGRDLLVDEFVENGFFGHARYFYLDCLDL